MKTLQAFATALFTAVLLSSCDDDPAKPTPPATPEQVTVQWEHPFPVDYVVDVWGTASDNVFAVGAYGQILHYDGQEWTYVESPTRGHLLSMWGLPNGDIWAVGWSGTIIHFDGVKWNVQDSGTQQSLFGIWASSPDTVLAVGWSGTLLRYDGASWESMTSPTTSDLLSIWGTSASDLYVGARDALLHFDGTTWTDVGIQVRVRVIGIWGASPNDVWATDGTNLLWHFDGAEWQNVNTRVNYPFVSLWGFASDSIFGCGQGGFVSRFDGTSWSEKSLGDLWLDGLWGAADNDVWATGTVREGIAGVLFHYDGVEWKQFSHAAAVRGLGDIWSDAAGDVAYVVGSSGQVLTRRDGTWEAVPTAPDKDFTAVWGAPSGTIFLTTSDGTCQRFDGVSWEEFQIGSGARMTDVWGTSEVNVFAGSTQGVWRFDGLSWSPMSNHDHVTAMSGSGASDIYAAGVDSLFENGIVRRFDGTTWTEIYSQPGMYIPSIESIGPGEAVIIEADQDALTGRLLMYNGSSWDDISPSEVTNFSAIGWNEKLGLLTSGYNMDGNRKVRPALLRFDQGSWQRVQTQFFPGFSSIWGGLNEGAYLVGGSAIARCTIK
jgi:hypothetical protein